MMNRNDPLTTAAQDPGEPMGEDELRSLLSRVEPLRMPHAAAQAVRQGTRVRRRRRVLAGTAVALTVAGGVSLAATQPWHMPVPEPGRVATPSPVPTSPSPTPSPLADVGTAQLATPADLGPLSTGTAPLGTPTDLPVGQWGTAVSLCRATPQGLGQSSLRVRRYARAGVTEAVLGFDTVAEASTARATILRWYQTCAGKGGWTGKSLPVAASGVSPVTATIGEASRKATVNDLTFELAVVVQAGNRVAWLVQQAVGQDQECSLVANDPNVGQCGPFAAARAVTSRLAR